MKGYEVKIKESSVELTAKERIKVKDLSNAVKLDSACEEGSVMITPDYFVILDIHNEKSDNKDYTNLMIADKSGQKFATGSPSFIDSFMDIWEEMQESAPDEDFSIEVYKLDSKNYKGKKFLTCSIM